MPVIQMVDAGECTASTMQFTLCYRTSLGPTAAIKMLLSSALGKLEAAASLFAPMLLTLHHAAITGEEAPLAQMTVGIRILDLERAGNAQDHGAGLAGRPAPHDANP